MERKKQIQLVILNLIQDLQRLPLLLLNNMRGRFQIKFGMTSLLHKGAFTLIELLVVVLIIGILAAVAVPQYQKVVLKSRFSKLMPIGKSLAQANETYFLANGVYSERLNQLDVGHDTENLPDGTRILLSDDEIVSFVRLSNDTLPNARYLVYQKNSANFPDTTMCEAQKDDEKANWLCEKGLNGHPIPTGNSGNEVGWNAYLLTGTPKETDHFAITDADAPCKANQIPPEDILAVNSGATGTATCVNGRWKYAWTNGTNYNTDLSINDDPVCMGDAANACSGATFSGRANKCEATAEKGCINANFSGPYVTCVGRVENGCADSVFNYTWTNCAAYAENACKGSVITGFQSYCYGYAERGCSGTTVRGSKAACRGKEPNGCTGVILQAGAYCNPEVAGGCNGALYGTNPSYTGANANLLASCDDTNGYCPRGVPVTDTSWDAKSKIYNITGWKDDCCNPAYMVSGVCPSDVTICS